MNERKLAASLERVAGMVVVLDSVPNPTSLKMQIKEVRDYLTDARRILNEIRKHRNLLETSLSTMESEYDLKFMELMATDDEVKAGGSVTDRKAMARWKLREQVKEIDGQRIEVSSAVAAERMVWEVVKNLDGTSTDIARQMKLIRIDEALGGDDRGRGEEPEADEEMPGFDADGDDLEGADDGDLTGDSHTDDFFGDSDEEAEPKEDPEEPEPENGDSSGLDEDDPPPDDFGDDDEWADLLGGMDDVPEPGSSPEDTDPADVALDRIVVKKPDVPLPPDIDLDEMLDAI